MLLSNEHHSMEITYAIIISIHKNCYHLYLKTTLCRNVIGAKLFGTGIIKQYPYSILEFSLFYIYESMLCFSIYAIGTVLETFFVTPSTEGLCHLKSHTVFLITELETFCLYLIKMVLAQFFPAVARAVASYNLISQISRWELPEFTYW